MDQRVRTVLLVDRDRRVRGAVRTFLTAAGLAVAAEAGDARAARSAVQRVRPQIAVVDPQLPTAAAGCSLIEELSDGCRTLVIALTSDPRLLEPARAAGAARALTKACTPEDLLEALQGAATDLDHPEDDPIRVPADGTQFGPVLTSARGGTDCAGPD